AVVPITSRTPEEGQRRGSALPLTADPFASTLRPASGRRPLRPLPAGKAAVCAAVSSLGRQNGQCEDGVKVEKQGKERKRLEEGDAPRTRRDPPGARFELRPFPMNFTP